MDFNFNCMYFCFPGIADEMSYLEDICFPFKKKIFINLVLRTALSWREGGAEMQKCKDRSPDLGPPISAAPSSPLPRRLADPDHKSKSLCHLPTKPSRKPPFWGKRITWGSSQIRFYLDGRHS